MQELIKLQDQDNIIGKFDNGESMLLKVGRYGPYLELLDSKKRKSIPKSIGIENVTEKIAKDLLSLPKNLGSYLTITTGIDIQLWPMELVCVMNGQQ